MRYGFTRPAWDEDPDPPRAEDLLFLQATHHRNDHRTQVRPPAG